MRSCSSSSTKWVYISEKTPALLFTGLIYMFLKKWRVRSISSVALRSSLELRQFPFRKPLSYSFSIRFWLTSKNSLMVSHSLWITPLYSLYSAYVTEPCFGWTCCLIIGCGAFYQVYLGDGVAIYWSFGCSPSTYICVLMTF